MKLWLSWERFWFAPQSLLGAGLFRMLLGFLLFTMYLIRFLDRDILLYENGLMSASMARDYLPDFYQTTLRWIPMTDTAVFWVSVSQLIGLLLLALGLLPRFATWIILFLHLALIHRNFTVIYGPDLIATFWLLYLGFIQLNQHFSVRWCLQKRAWTWAVFVNANDSVDSDVLSSMGLRLLQIQLCVIYAYTGLEKLKGSTWWDGTAVWRVLGNAQLAPIDMSWLSQVPSLVAILTFTTLIFEIYFPIVIWINRIKRSWLLIGILFHGGVGILMGLPFFSLLMMINFAFFLNRDEVLSLFYGHRFARGGI